MKECFLKQWKQRWSMWRIKYWVVDDNLRILKRIFTIKYQSSTDSRITLKENIWWDSMSYQGGFHCQDSAI